MAAVHYVRFPVSAEARAALGRSGERVRLVADHPNYRAQAEVSPETRAQMLADLAGGVLPSPARVVAQDGARGGTRGRSG